MDWITANWFWILIGILFIGMHLFGHGGHGGHGGHSNTQPRGDEAEKTGADNRAANTGSSGHQH